MLEILNQQFKNGRSLASNKYLSPLRRELWPKFHWDMYPLAQEYYHELNPFLLSNAYSPEFFKLYKMYTARDGMMTLADFILSNFNQFSKLGTKLFLIHPGLAPLVPPHLSQFFGSWTIVKKNPIMPSEAKKILIFTFTADQYLGNLDEIPQRLSVLKNLRSDVEIELYIPIRKNIFIEDQRESNTPFVLMNYLHEAFPGKKFKLLTSEQFMGMSDFRGTYLLDLAPDQFYISDSFVHYHVLSKNGSVHGVPTSAPKDSVFELAVSLHHELHVSPLPKVDSIFTDLLFYKKQSSGKDLIFDPYFQELVREGLKTKS